MRRRIGLIIGAGLATAAGTQLIATRPTAAALTHPPTAIAVLGPRVAVRPGRFVRAYAMCPRGYRVTGGGAYSGAISEIISSPLADLRGWFVDGTNTDRAGRTFSERADAVCLRVSGSPTATPAATPALWPAGALATNAERAYVATHHGER